MLIPIESWITTLSLVLPSSYLPTYLLYYRYFYYTYYLKSTASRTHARTWVRFLIHVTHNRVFIIDCRLLLLLTDFSCTIFIVSCFLWRRISWPSNTVTRARVVPFIRLYPNTNDNTFTCETTVAVSACKSCCLRWNYFLFISFSLVY